MKINNMTQEEKAKAYDKAIERAKSLIGDTIIEESGQHIAEVIFPELKESEDERIRKAIHIYLDWLDGHKDYQPKGNYTIKDMLAWLEKQGETYTKRDVDDAWLKGMCDAKREFEKQGEKPVIEMKSPEESLGISSKEYNDIVNECLFGKSKSAEKVEPKFHEGEWIVFNGLTLYIKEVVKGFYRTISKDGIPNSYDWDIDNLARLWSLEDARDGDVLVCKGNIKYSNGIKYERICLFNNVDKAFFTLTKTSNFVEEYGIDVNIDYPDNTVPATKEQKEILFMVMKEAGYEWDAEKKELKKIEQKPVLDFKANNWYVSKVDGKIHDMTYNPANKFNMKQYIDKDMELTYKDIEIILGIENNILHECNDNSQLVIEAYPKGDDYYGEILRRFNNQRIKPQRMISVEAKEAMYDKPASTWSEEDEDLLFWTINNLTELKNRYGKNYGKSGKCIDWLKSFKERIGG